VEEPLQGVAAMVWFADMEPMLITVPAPRSIMALMAACVVTK